MLLDPKAYRNDLDLNLAIEKFVSELPDGEVRSLAQQEREFLLAYSGSGQTFKQTQASNDAKLFEFYTPDYIRELMWKLAYVYGYDGGAVLEPSCATGHFLLGAPTSAKCTGFEINPITYKIARHCFPRATFYNLPFETAFLNNFRGRFTKKLDKKVTWLDDYPFSLVIGNPPYGAWQTEYPYFKENYQQIEIFFLIHSLLLLKPGGVLVFLTAASWLRNGNSYQHLKKTVGTIAELVDAYRTGEVFKRTGVPTDILIYKRS